MCACSSCCIRAHLPTAGKRSLGEVTPEVLAAATEANRNWLEDCLVLLLCVLALDRFADYGSDQVRGLGVDDLNSLAELWYHCFCCAR